MLAVNENYYLHVLVDDLHAVPHPVKLGGVKFVHRPPDDGLLHTDVVDDSRTPIGDAVLDYEFVAIGDSLSKLSPLKTEEAHGLVE